MKKLLSLVICLSFIVTSFTGCGPGGFDHPTKPAGPGGERQQPYDPDSGQYE